MNRPFISVPTFDPVDMLFHVLREIGSLVRALYYDNGSRNQDAFPLFYV